MESWWYKQQKAHQQQQPMALYSYDSYFEWDWELIAASAKKGFIET